MSIERVAKSGQKYLVFARRTARRLVDLARELRLDSMRKAFKVGPHVIFVRGFADGHHLIHITGEEALGFLVLLQVGTDYSGWSVDGTPLAGLKVLDLPQAEDWGAGDTGLVRYYRADGHSAAYSIVRASSAAVRVTAPSTLGLKSFTPPPTFSASSWVPRVRTDTGKVFFEHAPDVVIFDMKKARDPLPQFAIPVHSVTQASTRELAPTTFQWAYVPTATNPPTLQVREFSFDPDDGATTPLGATEFLASRAWYPVSGERIQVPHGLGQVSRLEPVFVDGGPAESFRHAFAGTPSKAYGLPAVFSTGGIAGVNPTLGYSSGAAPLETKVRVSGVEFSLSDATMSNGQGVFTTVFAVPVHVNGFDYWHVYSAHAVPTLTSPTGPQDHDADYPVTTVLRSRIIKADATSAVQMGSTVETTWVQTGAVTFSASADHTILAPLGGAVVEDVARFAGLKITFGPGGVPTYTPAQWTETGTVTAEYPAYAAPAGESDWGFNQATRYVAADERGVFFVMVDMSTLGGDPGPNIAEQKVYAVALGSADAPTLVVDPAAQAGLAQFPTADDFPVSTRLPVLI